MGDLVLDPQVRLYIETLEASRRVLAEQVLSFASEVNKLRLERLNLEQATGKLKSEVALLMNRAARAELKCEELERLLHRITDNYQVEPDCGCDRCRALPDVRAALASPPEPRGITLDTPKPTHRHEFSGWADEYGDHYCIEKGCVARLRSPGSIGAIASEAIVPACGVETSRMEGTRQICTRPRPCPVHDAARGGR